MALVVLPSAASASGVSYARVERVCSAPVPGAAACMAMVRRPVASTQAGEPGVHAYTAPAEGHASAGPAGGLTPSDLAGAYGYNPASGGEGQTIAIVDAYNDPNIASDLNEFDVHYGLGECTEANGCFKKVGQTGKTTSLPPNDTRAWSVETSLDVEAARSACLKCKLLLVEANDEFFNNLGAAENMAVKLGATAVSNSYGGYEEPGTSVESEAYNHPGVLITASTGDQGWASWVRFFEGIEPPSPAAPNTPSSLPTVVAVGGTTLHITSAEKRSSETVWNGNGSLKPPAVAREGATGGGCSILFTAPVWQKEARGFSATGCGDKRSAGDVAAVADPVTGFDIYDTYNCGSACENFKHGKSWSTIGGTSLSAPLVTGMWALAGGAQGVRYPASTLYEHLGDSAATFDVSKGGNGYCDAEGKTCAVNAFLVEEELGEYEFDCEGTTECNATTGFDGPTGVGAPNSLAIFKPAGERELKEKAEEEAKRKGEEEAKRKGEEEAAARKAEEEAAHRKAEEEARKAGGSTGSTGGGAGTGVPGLGVSPFKTAAPKATLAGTGVKVSKGGAFKLDISCPAGSSGCEGTITLSAAGAGSARRHVLTFATASFKVAPGKTVAIRLHLNGKARRLLGRRHVLRARVSIASHDGSGQTGSSQATATLRSAARNKHR